METYPPFKNINPDDGYDLFTTLQKAKDALDEARTTLVDTQIRLIDSRHQSERQASMNNYTKTLLTEAQTALRHLRALVDRNGQAPETRRCAAYKEAQACEYSISSLLAPKEGGEIRGDFPVSGEPDQKAEALAAFNGPFIIVHLGDAQKGGSALNGCAGVIGAPGDVKAVELRKALKVLSRHLPKNFFDFLVHSKRKKSTAAASCQSRARRR